MKVTVEVQQCSLMVFSESLISDQYHIKLLHNRYDSPPGMRTVYSMFSRNLVYCVWLRKSEDKTPLGMLASSALLLRPWPDGSNRSRQYSCNFCIWYIISIFIITLLFLLPHFSHKTSISYIYLPIHFQLQISF